jgi:hypothetical protein
METLWHILFQTLLYVLPCFGTLRLCGLRSSRDLTGLQLWLPLVFYDTDQLSGAENTATFTTDCLQMVTTVTFLPAQ